MKTKSENIVVSLTSFPARINHVHIVIKSLLAQSVKPNIIILYLYDKEFKNKTLPTSLTNLQQQGVFEIRFIDQDLKSYNKLLWALQDFPESIIITIDDDIIYPKNLIKNLLKTHAKHPIDICAHRVRKIHIENNMIRPYNEWPLSEQRTFLQNKFHSGYNLLQCGVGGVLYPPNSLDSEVTNIPVFTKLCKHQDDVWFWAMAVKNNRKVITTKYGYNVKKRTIQSIQTVGLWNSINNKQNSPNNTAIENVLIQYPEIKEKLNIK